MYTADFTERHELLANLVAANVSTEQNTGYVEVGRFHRVFVQIIPVVLTGAIDVDIEEATDTDGTGAQAFDDGDKDVTIAATDTNPTAINIQTEEFTVNGAYDALNIEATPAGQGEYFVIQVWGCEPRDAPVATTNLEEVVS